MIESLTPNTRFSVVTSKLPIQNGVPTRSFGYSNFHVQHEHGRRAMVPDNLSHAFHEKAHLFACYRGIFFTRERPLVCVCVCVLWNVRFPSP